MSEQYNKMIRLVDGEMTTRERQNFLRNLDQNDPQGWRDLALGFVENQMITEALLARQVGQVETVKSLKKSSSWNLAWIGGMAATLMLGLWVGTVKPGGESQTEMNQNVTSTPEPSESLEISNPNFALTGGVQSVEKLNSVLKEQGYAPRMTRGFIEAQLADGRQLIIPISQLAMNE